MTEKSDSMIRSTSDEEVSFRQAQDLEENPNPLGNEEEEMIEYTDDRNQELELGATAASTQDVKQRQCTQTAKGKEYRIDLLKSNFNKAVSRWRKQANAMAVLVIRTEDTVHLTKELELLTRLMDDVVALGEQYQLEQPVEDKIYEKFETVEQEHLDITKRISTIVYDIQSESGSVRSTGSRGRRRQPVPSTDNQLIDAGDYDTTHPKERQGDHIQESSHQEHPSLSEYTNGQAPKMSQQKEEEVPTGSTEAHQVDENKSTSHFKRLSDPTTHQNQMPIVDKMTAQPPHQLNHAASPFFPDQTTPGYRHSEATHLGDARREEYAATSHTRHDYNDISTNTLTQMMFHQASLSRLPPPEPSIFDGKHIEYGAWKTSFDLLIDQRPISPAEKLHYLRRYVSGTAKECIEGFFIGSSPAAYDNARRRLEERFGNTFCIGQAFRKRLLNWPKINRDDGVGLQRFSDFLRQCESAMESNPNLGDLNHTTTSQEVLRKLPETMRASWLHKVKFYENRYKIYPPLSEFANFMADQSYYANHPVASENALRDDPKNTQRPSRSGNQKKIAFATGVRETSSSSRQRNESKPRKQYRCLICSQDHWLGLCDKFTEKPIAERRDFAKKKGLCFNCLSANHLAKECNSKYRCRSCKKKHATCLHSEESDSKKTSKSSNASEKQASPESVEKAEAVVSHSTRITGGSKSSMVVPVFLFHDENPDKKVLIYALLDTQSDSTFISENVCDKLQLNGVDTHMTLSTMSALEEVSTCRKVTNLSVYSYDGGPAIPIRSAYTRATIPMNRRHIPSRETAHRWPHLSHIASEFPPKVLNCDIGLLIGYDCPKALMPRDVIPAIDEGPYAVRTDLGWSIVGLTDPNGVLDDENVSYSHRITTHEATINTTKEVINPTSIIKMLESDFIERQTHKKSPSNEDRRFLQTLTTGIHTTDDNHYEMPLPFKMDTPLMPNNKEQALRRLEMLQKCLRNDEEYRREYTAFINEILRSGYAEEVPKADQPTEGSVSYIPHHGVYHPTKKKLRVVFDCSARYHGVSLNDQLLPGPDLINGLVGVLCRFRKNKVAVVCDIKKMFYQFRVNVEHRNFLRFLWWREGQIDSTPVEYRMKVHLFGAVSSPGCSNFGLQQAASDGEERFGKQAAAFVKNDFYVDDGLTSVETASEAIQLIANTKGLCEDKGIKLHQFASNDQEVLKSIPNDERAECVKEIDFADTSTAIERVLGVQWSLEDDCFRFRITLKDRPATRRGILSAVSAVYDPLGFLSPLVLTGKRILQDICIDKTDWDDPLSDEIVARWQKWCSDLHVLESLKIPRCFKPDGFGKVKVAELHHFSDASTVGYGSCSYLRLVNEEDVVWCSLVMGKARVTPLRPVSIPRLELTASVLSVKIADLLKSELKIPEVSEFFWSDSKVVLGYIANDARRFHIFVANRVQSIRDTTDAGQWNYVRTNDNPADCASRGLTASSLLDNSLWFSGPQFLWTSDWYSYVKENPIQKTVSTDDPEVKRCLGTARVQVFDIDSRLASFSNWFKARRAIANILELKRKLRKQCRPDGNEKTAQTNVEAMKEAEMIIIKGVQGRSFAKPIEIMTNQDKPTNRLRRHDPVLRLDPELDELGIVRVGGKLRQSSLPFEEKHPIILPKVSNATRLIIQACHEEVAHQGRGMTLNCIRSSGYCIMGGNSAVRSMISKCVYCRRWRSKPQTQKMADLPVDRFEEAPPFTYCAVDYFGPFTIRIRRSDVPRYGVLFTCLASRAIHLEVADSLETDAFINALRRFIAIRGPIRLLRSDRGTNFVGAKNEQNAAIDAMRDDKLRQFLLRNGADIEFKMNVPSASHMGGVWERQIRTVRSVLAPMLHQHGMQLDDDSLRTLFYEVTAIVNSRPLTTDTLSDNSSPSPLSPNHLLTAKTSVVLPPPAEFQQADMYSRKRWRRVQYLLNVFWSRWRVEFLQTLQMRNKWHYPQRDMQEGDVVLVKDHSDVRNHWPLAVVEETYASKDGHIRKVKLRMASRNLDKNGHPTRNIVYLERPIHKLVLLVESMQ